LNPHALRRRNLNPVGTYRDEDALARQRVFHLVQANEDILYCSNDSSPAGDVESQYLDAISLGACNGLWCGLFNWCE
jgi:hypothetical protein